MCLWWGERNRLALKTDGMSEIWDANNAWDLLAERGETAEPKLWKVTQIESIRLKPVSGKWTD
jgi:hypothetical protein